jgi:hypothetical protein
LRERFFYNLPINDTDLSSDAAKNHLTEALKNLVKALEEAKIPFTGKLFVFENLKVEDDLTLAKRGIREFLTQKLINTRDPVKFKERLKLYSAYLDKIGWFFDDVLSKSTQVEEFEANASFLRVQSNLWTFSAYKTKNIPGIDDLINGLVLRNLPPFLQQFARFPNCMYVFNRLDKLPIDSPIEFGLLIFIFNVFSKVIFEKNYYLFEKENIKKILNSIFAEQPNNLLFANAIYELEGLKIHYINEGLIKESDPISSSINRYIVLFRREIEPHFSFNQLKDFLKQGSDWETKFQDFVTFFGKHRVFLDLKKIPLIAIQYLDSLLTTDLFDMKFKCLLLAYLPEKITIDSKDKLRGYFSNDDFLGPLITKAIDNVSSLEDIWNHKDLRPSLEDIWNPKDLRPSLVFKKFIKELEKLRTI